MAVLCSPAGICVADAAVAAAQAARPVHAHACCEEAAGPSIASSDGACCAEPQNGFVNVLRYTLQKQEAGPSLVTGAEWTSRILVTNHSALVRLAPLVLRI